MPQPSPDTPITLLFSTPQGTHALGPFTSAQALDAARARLPQGTLVVLTHAEPALA